MLSIRRLLPATAAVAMLAGAAPSASAAAVKNVVLVHGAFADGSGWKAVYEILKKDGYSVSIVQEPETSLADDVAATRRVLAQQSGPAILVGHSYGGAVITGAGTAPNVAGLVFVAAVAPDKGESVGQLLNSIKPATNGGRPTQDGYIFLDPAEFRADFAADLPAAQTELMARSQVPVSAAAFTAPTVDVAWKDKPSWAIVATEDKAINPDLERSLYKRANAQVTEIKASHAVYISHPREVAKVIEQAAQQAAK
jgi:pimeloyl-ACP methyl ester carboxylesterase